MELLLSSFHKNGCTLVFQTENLQSHNQLIKNDYRYLQIFNLHYRLSEANWRLQLMRARTR